MNSLNSCDFTQILDGKNRKIKEQVQSEYANGSTRPLICYALDPSFVDDQVWEHAKDASEFEKITTSNPYLALVFWSRLFFEESDGRNVWGCLPTDSKDVQKKLKSYAKCLEWENELLSGETLTEGHWFQWMGTQCWMLAATKAGITSRLIPNNKRLCGYIPLTTEYDSLSHYVKDEWSQEELQKNEYLTVLAKKYSKEVILSLKSLSRNSSQEEREEHKWLQPLYESSLKDRIDISAEWSFRDSDIFLEFKGDVKRKIQLGSKEFRIYNKRISLTDVLSSVSPEDVKKGIIYSYGNRFDPLNLEHPQLFMRSSDKLFKLVDTRKDSPIQTEKSEIKIYLPDKYSSENEYALRFMANEVPLRQIESCKERSIYEAEICLYDSSGKLELIDINSPESDTYLFSSKFGVFPEIRHDPLKNSFNSKDADVCLIEEIVNFYLVNCPKSRRLTWKLEKPDGSFDKPWNNDLTKEEPIFIMSKKLREDGLYILRCNDSGNNILATKKILYISNLSHIQNNPLSKYQCPDNHPGYCYREIKLSERIFMLEYPLNSGEGTWQWKKEFELSAIGPSSDDNMPQDILAKWKLKLNIIYMDKEVSRPEVELVCFNGHPLSTIVSQAEEMVEYDNFIDACFSRHDWATPLYQFFTYGEDVEVTYAGRLIFSYKNIPVTGFSKSLLMKCKQGNFPSFYIWCPNKSVNTALINEKEVQVHLGQHCLCHIPQNFNNLRSVKVDDVTIYPYVDRQIKEPSHKGKDIFRNLKVALSQDKFNFLSMKIGDDWVKEQLSKLKGDYINQFFNYLYSNPKKYDILKIDTNKDTIASTFIFIVTTFIQRKDISFISGMKDICPEKFPDKEITLLSLCGGYSTLQITQYLESNRFWKNGRYCISYKEYTEKTHESLPLESVNDFIDAIHYACMTCPDDVEVEEFYGDTDEVFLKYYHLCLAFPKWESIANDCKNNLDKLNQGEELLLKTIFICRMHLRLVPDMPTCQLPLDKEAQETSVAMITRLSDFFEDPHLLVALIQVATIFEHYILRKA